MRVKRFRLPDRTCGIFTFSPVGTKVRLTRDWVNSFSVADRAGVIPVTMSRWTRLLLLALQAFPALTILDRPGSALQEAMQLLENRWQQTADRLTGRPWFDSAQRPVCGTASMKQVINSFLLSLVFARNAVDCCVDAGLVDPAVSMLQTNCKRRRLVQERWGGAILAGAALQTAALLLPTNSSQSLVSRLGDPATQLTLTTNIG